MKATYVVSLGPWGSLPPMTFDEALREYWRRMDAPNERSPFGLDNVDDAEWTSDHGWHDGLTDEQRELVENNPFTKAEL